MAPPYQRRDERSCSSIKRIAQSFGAPVTVTAQAWLRNPSSASNSGRSSPSTWSTVWISREYSSIWRRPMTSHAARRRHPRLVVAVDIGAHRQFALVLGRVQEFADALGVLDRVAAAGDRAADRAGLDAPFLRPARYISGEADNQKLALAQIDQRAIGRRVGLAQPLEDDARRVGAGAANNCPGTTSNRSPRTKASLARLDERGIFARGVVALARASAGTRSSR